MVKLRLVGLSSDLVPMDKVTASGRETYFKAEITKWDAIKKSRR